MKLSTTRASIAALLLAGLVVPGLAHSTVKRTVPASGSVLPSSPSEVLIEFNEPARMTGMVVVAAEQSERKLAFDPTGEATSFVAKEPRLGTGRNEVKWKALSKDGHPISGTIIVVIKPGAKPAQAAPAHPGH